MHRQRLELTLAGIGFKMRRHQDEMSRGCGAVVRRRQDVEGTGSREQVRFLVVHLAHAAASTLSLHVMRSLYLACNYPFALVGRVVSHYPEASIRRDHALPIVTRFTVSPANLTET